MTPRRPWTVRADDQVHDFLADQEELVEYAIRQDIKKLRIRGVDAREPLVKHLEEGVYYLRTKCSQGAYRVFYFRDGERSFRAFYAFKKESQQLPRHVRETVMRRYREIRGG